MVERCKVKSCVRTYIRRCSFLFIVFCVAAAAQLFFLENTQSVLGASIESTTEIKGDVIDINDNKDLLEKNNKISELFINKKDADLDGMSDEYEMQYGLDTKKQDQLLDPDEDKLLNIQEYMYGTDPHVFDTDGGGVGDGDERLFGTLPMDESDDFSMTIPNNKTYPISKITPFLMEKPSPLTRPDVDADGDGIPDFIEKRMGFDSQKKGDKTEDTDRDKFSNYEEFQLGTLANDNDTDKDGLSDGDEVLIYKSNPLASDTDGDGISDVEEVVVTKTNPVLWDTNLNGVSDYTETKNKNIILPTTQTETNCFVDWNDFRETDSYIIDSARHEIKSFPDKIINIPINCSVKPDSFQIQIGENEFFVQNKSGKQESISLEITVPHIPSNYIVSITPVFQTVGKEKEKQKTEEIMIGVIKSGITYETQEVSNNFFTKIFNKIFYKSSSLKTKGSFSIVSNTRLIIYEWNGRSWKLTKKTEPVRYTDEKGNYFFSLEPGKYTIRAEKKGYKTWQSMMMQIDKKSLISIDIPMKRR